MADTPQIILYHYAYSPYARRIQWYLLLRGLPFSECIQPPTMPRPDIARLGVRHRRIPVLAIGRDVYLDTRLMLRKLEQITSSSVRPPLGVGSSGASLELLALERLLNVLTADSGLFFDAARLIPADVPAMKDPVFGRDRLDFFGGPLDPRPPKKSAGAAGAAPEPSSPTSAPLSPSSAAPAASPALRRAEALAEVRHAAALLETTLLADGRTWILNTPEPSVADIEAVWPFHWLASMPGAFLDGSGSKEATLTPAQFPRLFAWVDRFNGVIRAARKAQLPPAARVDGQKAAEAVLAAPHFEAQPSAGAEAPAIDPTDPVARAAGLRVGQTVVVWPTDTGASHKDVGRLVRLASDEVVLEVAPSEGAPSVLLHAPRHGFRVRPLEEAEGPRL